MVLTLLYCYVLQIVSTIGMIALFGFLIALCNKLFYRNWGSHARLACYVTGFIGTPVHELSHALFCILFWHKITEIKLFQVNSEDGCLGYVTHTYNPKNLYQKAGNFFIGIAPILVISTLLFGFAYLLMPELIQGIINVLREFRTNSDSINLAQSIADILYLLAAHMADYRFWIFIVIGAFFALHMTLSKADVKGALSGLILVLCAVLIVDIILVLISGRLLGQFTIVVWGLAIALDFFLVISFVISLIAVAFSFVFRLCLLKVKKK